ncbi:TetR/AcrR family transcriptional regulator [Variovorax sp. NFACC27]|jgi:AcrR family transcriptional regulator|uniref:TetR/AcrR family transcriptional regulator n=1 Tax=unclassified Variovorax TaxID=663243 RepID=UPI00089CC406|nr:TetR/AcrR family transcriptional regulator [Variovorax sp. YR750]SEF29955.1 transcriptional regulator, TetR family [Variovorax sp. NFACC28]SEG85135.1 transcriptional regulator, TetR family [Variovorax sp. NFACC29]SFD19563.1 transcriptional regulator, TetR family [Variovorax sp. NFACC26]SFG26782.1 transcriptional regulator, TetR family [Variovorax sp. NFACC27]SEL53951.1 transcriptional regulator, TetR family [Variovorax sp. YR750]
MKVRTEARRNVILEAAVALFKELGYERSSMNELAKRLGGSKATLYGYFASKEELFRAVVQTVAVSHLAEAAAELQEVSETATLEAQLMRFGERMLFVLTNDADALAVYRMVLAEAGRSDVGQQFQESGPTEYIRTLAGFMEAAMARGELRRMDPHVTALQFTALVTAETQRRLFQANPEPVSVEEIRALVERAVEMFLAGATPR